MLIGLHIQKSFKVLFVTTMLNEINENKAKFGIKLEDLAFP